MRHFTIKTLTIGIFLLIMTLPSALFALGGGGGGSGPVQPCSEAKPFCSDQSYDFPNETNASAPSGPDYGCLGSEPNPVWYYMKIAESGPMQLHLEQQNNNNNNGIDIDFALWGPFIDVASGCTEVMGGIPPPIQCSYSPAPTETIGLGMPGGYSGGATTPPDAQVGEYYILILTNYNGASGHIMLEQTDGTGKTDCSILDPCDITSLTANISACDNDLFSGSIAVEFNDAPDTGDLIIEDCNGNQIVVASAPFTSPVNLNLVGQDADGNPCSATAYFSEKPSCSATVNYTAPECSPCIPPSLTLNDIYMCEGGDIDLNEAVDPSSDPGTKTFYNTQTDASQAINPIENIVSTDGSYWVRAEDASDPTCFNYYEIQVGLITVTYTADNTDETCESSNGEIILTADGGNGPYNYSIDNGANTQSEGTFSSLSDSTYDIVITDSSGCEVTGTETITNSGINDDSSFSLTDFCEGATNSANITGTTGGTFSIVSPTGDGATINASTGEISNGVEGTPYTITYETSGACPSSSTEQVTVLASPNVSFNATPEHGASPLTVEFENTTPDSNNYIWDFGEGDPLSNNNVILSHTYNNNGNYIVILTGESTEGCVATLTIHIIVKPSAMEYTFPNIFTPNDDNQNDVFKLIHAKRIAALEIVILNRWGNVVFEDNKVNFNWNGKVKNSGANCGDGTYFYKAEIKGIDGTEKTEHGFVQLSRDK